MLPRIFKRSDTRKTAGTDNHQVFLAQYNALKPHWLQEQRNAKSLSSAEQQQISLTQNNALKMLISNLHLNESKYLREYPVPTLTDTDMNLELQTFEKELDTTFRKEIGKIVPLLHDFTISGVERYISTLDTALFSLAKNDTRKELLDQLAVYYVPSLIIKDKGLIKSYYQQHLRNRDHSTTYTLLSTFENIVELMELDGHRAMLGASIHPPKQLGTPIGNYIKMFENYVLRIDGFCMDSNEMLDNIPLNNDRRRQFINGLDSNIRIIVPQPEYHSPWHAFIQAYSSGYSRLYPNKPLFGKTSYRNNRNFVNHKGQYKKKLPFNSRSPFNKDNNKRFADMHRKNQPFNNNKTTKFPQPSFLKNNPRRDDRKSSHIHRNKGNQPPVKKKNDEWRFVVDFRAINKIIQPQSHHIPRIDSILDKAAGNQFYTSLDLKNGFHQLTLDKSSRYLTGFPTHIGIFQYKRIPMGLVGSPDFFNHVMEKIFNDDNKFVYLDDILLTDNEIPVHIENIKSALEKAHTLGLKFSLSKCLFFQQSLEYLGFIISKDGVTPNPAKTKALAEKPIPKNEKELRSFLGTANYYRKHIPSYSKIAGLLYNTINNFIWTNKHTEAFENLKQAIISACTLAPPDPTKTFTIMTDASIQGLGAALMQEDRPIAFASRTLKKSKTMYAPVQLEALGLVYALKQFSPYIYGKRSVVLTDQSSLLSLMTKKDVSNILDRYKNYIMGFDLDIKYIKGSNNIVADYLSRKIFNINLTNTLESYTDVFPKVTTYLQYPFILNNFYKYLSEKEKDTYPNCKTSLRGKIRLYVPQKLRFMVLTRWHEHPLLGNHNGYDKGAPKFKDSFHWPAIDNDIKRVWSSCTTCLTNKPHGPLQATVHDKKIPIPPFSWHTLSVDHLVISENNYVLVIIDEYSRFVHLHHTTNMGTSTTIKLLKLTFFLLGFPHTLKTDNGSALLADLFKNFCTTYNIEHYAVSAYNHQGNGIVERFNRTIQESLRIYKEKHIHDIINSTQYVHNFSYSTNQDGKPKEYIISNTDRFTDESYANNTLSGRLSLLQFIKEQLRIHSSTDDFESNDFVKLSPNTIVYKKIVNAHKNDKQFNGPFKIMEHLHGDTYLIGKVTNSHRYTGHTERCNARFLKLAPVVLQNTLGNKLHNNPDISHQNTPSTLDLRQTQSIKKGRGRPKKLVPHSPKETPNLENTFNHQKDQTKKGRGRPKKITSNNPITDNINRTPTPPKRGRGRPKKN
uniref:RNA-directed DNA polymerase n=1 Tax=Strongyloides venezuelensis TaxID=75913 RepID=A0A0K0G3G2_STRVS